MKKTLLITALLVLTGSAFAQASPAGLWKKERSLIRISEAGGVFNGKIEKRLDADAKPTDICDQCTDERKNQPILGLTLIRNVKQSADDKNLWEGGDITDPDNGKIYKVRLKPIEDGKKLEVRGYIGMPMLGRTQTWIRVE
jgi:uncharacterized protein (DUF2147 family)